MAIPRKTTRKTVRKPARASEPTPKATAKRKLSRATANVKKILRQFTDNQSEFGNVDTDVTDLLSDIMHFCSAKGVDFDDCVRRAYGHHGAEAHTARTGQEV